MGIFLAKGKSIKHQLNILPNKDLFTSFEKRQATLLGISTKSTEIVDHYHMEWLCETSLLGACLIVDISKKCRWTWSEHIFLASMVLKVLFDFYFEDLT